MKNECQDKVNTNQAYNFTQNSALAVLEFPAGAMPTLDELKRQYRKLIKLTHPDKMPSDTSDEATKKLNAANEYLNLLIVSLSQCAPGATATPYNILKRPETIVENEIGKAFKRRCTLLKEEISNLQKKLNEKLMAVPLFSKENKKSNKKKEGNTQNNKDSKIHESLQACITDCQYSLGHFRDHEPTVKKILDALNLNCKILNSAKLIYRCSRKKTEIENIEDQEAFRQYVKWLLQCLTTPLPYYFFHETKRINGRALGEVALNNIVKNSVKLLDCIDEFFFQSNEINEKCLHDGSYFLSVILKSLLLTNRSLEPLGAFLLPAINISYTNRFRHLKLTVDQIKTIKDSIEKDVLVNFHLILLAIFMLELDATHLVNTVWSALFKEEPEWIEIIRSFSDSQEVDIVNKSDEEIKIKTLCNKIVLLSDEKVKHLFWHADNASFQEALKANNKNLKALKINNPARLAFYLSCEVIYLTQLIKQIHEIIKNNLLEITENKIKQINERIDILEIRQRKIIFLFAYCTTKSILHELTFFNFSQLPIFPVITTPRAFLNNFLQTEILSHEQDIKRNNLVVLPSENAVDIYIKNCQSALDFFNNFHSACDQVGKTHPSKGPIVNHKFSKNLQVMLCCYALIIQYESHSCYLFIYRANPNSLLMVNIPACRKDYLENIAQKNLSLQRDSVVATFSEKIKETLALFTTLNKNSQALLNDNYEQASAYIEGLSSLPHIAIESLNKVKLEYNHLKTSKEEHETVLRDSQYFLLVYYFSSRSQEDRSLFISYAFDDTLKFLLSHYVDDEHNMIIKLWIDAQQALIPADRLEKIKSTQLTVLTFPSDVWTTFSLCLSSITVLSILGDNLQMMSEKIVAIEAKYKKQREEIFQRDLDILIDMHKDFSEKQENLQKEFLNERKNIQLQLQELSIPLENEQSQLNHSSINLNVCLNKIEGLMKENCDSEEKFKQVTTEINNQLKQSETLLKQQEKKLETLQYNSVEKEKEIRQMHLHDIICFRQKTRAQYAKLMEIPVSNHEAWNKLPDRMQGQWEALFQEKCITDFRKSFIEENELQAYENYLRVHVHYFSNLQDKLSKLKKIRNNTEIRLKNLQQIKAERDNQETLRQKILEDGHRLNEQLDCHKDYYEKWDKLLSTSSDIHSLLNQFDSFNQKNSHLDEEIQSLLIRIAGLNQENFHNIQIKELSEKLKKHFSLAEKADESAHSFRFSIKQHDKVTWVSLEQYRERIKLLSNKLNTYVNTKLDQLVEQMQAVTWKKEDEEKKTIDFLDDRLQKIYELFKSYEDIKRFLQCHWQAGTIVSNELLDNLKNHYDELELQRQYVELRKQRFLFKQKEINLEQKNREKNESSSTEKSEESSKLIIESLLSQLDFYNKFREEAIQLSMQWEKMEPLLNHLCHSEENENYNSNNVKLAEIYREANQYKEKVEIIQRQTNGLVKNLVQALFVFLHTASSHISEEDKAKLPFDWATTNITDDQPFHVKACYSDDNTCLFQVTSGEADEKHIVIRIEKINELPEEICMLLQCLIKESTLNANSQELICRMKNINNSLAQLLEEQEAFAKNQYMQQQTHHSKYIKELTALSNLAISVKNEIDTICNQIGYEQQKNPYKPIQQMKLKLKQLETALIQFQQIFTYSDELTINLHLHRMNIKPTVLLLQNFIFELETGLLFDSMEQNNFVTNDVSYASTSAFFSQAAFPVPPAEYIPSPSFTF